MINKTQTQLARIASSAALGAMSTMGAVFAQSGAYLPSDDLVVVEMEDLAEAAGWTSSSDLAGFAGRGYVEWSGPDMAKQPGTGLVGFETRLEAAGSYELRLHNRHDAPDVTDANDVWLRVDGGAWTKVFSSVRGDWTWDTRQRSTAGNVGPVVLELEAGNHKIELSGRSQGFKVDRVHLFKQGASNALSISHAVSSRVPTEPVIQPEVEAPQRLEAPPLEAMGETAGTSSDRLDTVEVQREVPEARSSETEPSASVPAKEAPFAFAAGGKSGKTLPVNLIQPRPIILSADQALIARKIRDRANSADDARGGGPAGPEGAGQRGSGCLHRGRRSNVV